MWHFNHKERRKIIDANDEKMKPSSYESFTFEVEKLSKAETSELFDTFVNEGILDRTFLNSGHFHHFHEEEDSEFLCYSFETGKKRIANFLHKSLILGYVNAFKNHFPMTISPDIFWTLIMQSLSRYMEHNHEKLRKMFVDFEGKKIIEIRRDYDIIKNPSLREYNSIINEITNKISDYIGAKYIENFTPNFSTTTPQSLICGKIAIMSCMKHFFEFRGFCTSCGISKMTIEGSVDDWLKLRTKIQNIGKIDEFLKERSENLLTVIDEIINTVKTKNPKIEFWKNFIRVKNEYDKYYKKNFEIIDGWIINFYLTGRSEIELDSFDVEIISAPMKIIVDDGKEEKEYDVKFESGFVGIDQDEVTFNVKPVIGYCIKLKGKDEE